MGSRLCHTRKTKEEVIKMYFGSMDTSAIPRMSLALVSKKTQIPVMTVARFIRKYKEDGEMYLNDYG